MKCKKLLAVLLAALCAMSLTACGGSSSSTSSSDSSDGNKNITLVLALRDEWLSVLADGCESAAKARGYSMNTVDCNNDASKAIQFVQTARNAGEEAIIINVVDPAQATALIEAAGDMKVVFVNRTPDDMGLLNDNIVYVGSNEMTSGAFQGEALAEYFKEKGKTEIKYILLNGTLGQTSTTNRTASVLQALADNGITATEASAPLVCEFDRATAMDQISPLLTAGVEFDCIISNNDAMALGAIEAMKAVGMDPASVPIVGIDCTADGAAAVASGEMYMTVFQNAEGQGNGAMQAAINLLNGAPINEGTDFEIDSENPHIVWIPFEPVDSDNVSDYQ